ncbi:mitogen activated protein kinase, putative [Leishmania tarentolae]|uniref:Mitogen activated protein kinase, putative n=1 Tax=Leishmania tarentolae TaxID=5689 RepID=A0A640KJB0_LEITA|nr:mitogen activated protein kinase, putative [Leishmania tarentolae]
MDKYEILAQIGDGTFGSVAKAVSKKTGQLVAIKKMKQKFYTWEECVKLPEVDVVRRIHGHPNVVKLREVIRENNELYFVFEHMDGDLLGVIKKAKEKGSPPTGASPSAPLIPYPLVKNYMRQMLQALVYIHKRGYFHRDMKPENLLIRKEASGDEVLKLADFGLVKEIRARPPFTDYVSTRWYRAPELLLQDRFYGAAVDVWAAGCIMAELITMRPLFPGTNEVDQLFKIMSVLGSPTEEVWAGGLRLAKKIRYNFPKVAGSGLAQALPSHIPSPALDLLRQMLVYDPKVRLTAEQCLQHPFFNVGIDECNAPSAAALDQLALMAKRMLPGSKTAPPALKSPTMDKVAAPKAVRAPSDASLAETSRKFYALGTLKDSAPSLPKLPAALSTSPPSLDALQNASSPLRGLGVLSPTGLPVVANGHSSPNRAATVTKGKRRSQETSDTLLSKKLAGLKNVPTGKGRLPMSYALPAASAVHSPTAAPNLKVSASMARPSPPAPTTNTRDVMGSPRHRNSYKEAETSSPPVASAAAKVDVDLDELMEEFASEMTAMGVLAQRHNSLPSSELKNESYVSQPALPRDPVATLLNNTRYRKKSTTSTDPTFKGSSSPRSTHQLDTKKVDEAAGKSDLPRRDHLTGKGMSPTLKALLAKHKAGGLAFP